ncbi:MAG TPA: hypothetical protein VMU30_06150 [Bacteroidota bacterium]|nr:hypothetical protein [Bacteroidota bacterium]
MIDTQVLLKYMALGTECAAYGEDFFLSPFLLYNRATAPEKKCPINSRMSFDFIEDAQNSMV